MYYLCWEKSDYAGEQVWRSGDSTRLPPTCTRVRTPGVDAMCGLSLVLVLSLAPRGFSLGKPVCSSLALKTNTSKFQFDLNCKDTFQRVLKTP